MLRLLRQIVAVLVFSLVASSSHAVIFKSGKFHSDKPVSMEEFYGPRSYGINRILDRLGFYADLRPGVRFSTGNLSTDLVRVRLYVLSQQIAKAFILMDEIKRQHGENHSTYSTEAEIYFAVGFWQKGLQLIEKAEREQPNNENYRERKKDVLFEHASNVWVDTETELTGSTTMELFKRAGVEYYRTPNTVYGATMERDMLRTPAVNLIDGSQLQFVRQNKHRMELFVKHDFLHGRNSTRGSVYLGEDAIGIGGEYNWIDIRGKTTVSGHINRVNWDFIEAFVQGGTEDSIRLTRQHRLAPRLTVTGAGGFDNYNLEADRNLAQSMVLNGVVQYLIKPSNPIYKILGKDAVASINYLFDAEYGIDVNERVNNAGVVFQPLPLSSREVHQISVGLRKEFSHRFYFDGFTGWGHDRFGGRGYTYGGLLAYRVKDMFEVQARASRDLSAELTNNTVERVGMNLKWVF